MFAVNDVSFYDVMCIPRGQADGTLFTRPFLPLWVGGAGARDYARCAVNHYYTILCILFRFSDKIAVV